MRLTAKLGLASTLAITSVAGLFGTERLDREMALFEDDMRRDHQAFGRALALAARVVATRHGIEEAKEVVAATNALEAAFTIEFKEGATPARKNDLISPRRLLAERELPDMVSIVPASLGRPGYLRVQESRAAQVKYVVETLERVLASLVLLITLSLTAIFSFGWWFVGHPLRALVDKVRRVGTGDLDTPVTLKQRDEMGLLAREINAMCDKLRSAQEQAAAEANARVRAIEQLRHADRLSTVGKLSSGLAHELGTPLNVVIARAKMIASGESAEGEVAEDATVIFEQAERIARIIRQLLDFSRQGTPQRSQQDVRDIVKKAVAVLGPLAARTRTELLLADGSPTFADVAAEQIQQVVTNVAMNAVQAHAEPGGCVRLHVFDAPPPDGTDSQGKWICIEVEDQGSGMPQDVVERIFEPFFTTKDVGQGTGLGLSVAHGIVQDHGGSITVESTVNVGTIVRVHLPVGGSSV